MMLRVLILLTLFSLSLSSWSIDRRGRMGVGTTNQMQNGIPALSFKLQKSRSFGLGGLVGIDTDDTSGGSTAALKAYRYLFDEPQLSFFGALTFGMIKQKVGGKDNSGFEFDATVGSEFSLAGLNSIGFSFEMGVSFNKLDDLVIETVGDSFLVSAVHFYL